MPCTYNPILHKCAICGTHWREGDEVYAWYEHYVRGCCAKPSMRLIRIIRPGDVLLKED